MNLKLCYIDNAKRPHETTHSSVKESKKLHASKGDDNERHASKGDDNERHAERSALNKAGDSRRKKKCQDEKATGNGKAGRNG